MFILIYSTNTNTSNAPPTAPATVPNVITSPSSTQPETIKPPVVIATTPNSTPAPETPVVTARQVPPSVAESTNVWANVWSRELQILADMGFTDTATLIPLLQEHVGLPVSLCPQLNGIPPADGMQKLLTVLLSRSGTFDA